MEGIQEGRARKNSRAKDFIASFMVTLNSNELIVPRFLLAYPAVACFNALQAMLLE
jgi:hypothetical protein